MLELKKASLDLQGKRVWVAGHNGMVGSALVRQLQQEKCEILSISKKELDLRRQAEVEHWMQQNSPDVIIVAAAKVGGLVANATYPAEFIYDNVMIAANIIHVAHQQSVEKLLFLGTSCIYPKFAVQPIREEALLSSSLEPTNEAYAVAKIAGLKLCKCYKQQYGCNFISAMPCNLYGLGDTYHTENSHVIPAMLMKFHAAKIRKDPSVTLWGTGTALREFLYADDLAKGLIHLLKTYEGEEHINLGSGKEIMIKDLARLAADVAGYSGDILYDTSRPDGTPRKVMDSSKILESGWHPETSLRSGLERAYRDYLYRYGDVSHAT